MNPFAPHSPKVSTARYLPRTRWWKIAGSTTALGAFAGAVHGETVQITLTDNQISNSLGDTLDADLTGDGNDEFKSIFPTLRSEPDSHRAEIRASTWNSFQFTAFAANTSSTYFAGIIATTSNAGASFGERLDFSSLVPIKFTDARINAGAETSGLLEVRARNVSYTNHQVTMVRLIFDDESTEEPTDAMVGGTKPDWVAPVIIPEAAAPAAAEISKLKRKVKKQKRLLRKARRNGNRVATARVVKKIKKLRAKLRAL